MDRIQAFNVLLRRYYAANKRILPWREHITPYGVVVSEIMLQQTQVPRVLVKYPEFLTAFPNFDSLAKASLEKVLRVWQGMGYNRRGRYLQQIAQKIMSNYQGKVPQDPVFLETFPGIGPATARSIATFIYNTPEIFIETNVRRVFIHHFFADSKSVHDNEIYPLVEQALDRGNPREWYYAIMDYGTDLKKTVGNANVKSKHYVKQSKFEGSSREIRSKILKQILLLGPQTEKDIMLAISSEVHDVQKILGAIVSEGLIQYKDSLYHIS